MWQQTKNIYHLFVAVIANIWFRFPSRKLTIVGVTGTDGKTTTVNLIYHILKASGKNVSMVSTVGAIIQGVDIPLNFHVTTPSSFQVQQFLFAAANPSKNSFVVLEVSSHAIDQFRVWGIPFSVGVITNITNEHLDYHKTYDRYLQTKAKLLRNAKIAVVNADDGSYQKLRLLVSSRKTITYGIYKQAVITPKTYNFKSTLIGEFNTYNSLAAIAACKAIGISDEDIKRGIETFQTPFGRMNKIQNNKGLTIIVDYAHTPNGLQQALTSLQSQKGKSGKIIALIGAEGFRDPGKREKLGEIAGNLADIVVITAVDPRGMAETINSQILKGAESMGKILGKTVFIEPDRAKAIRNAVTVLAKRGDTVGIFGKGHERSMNYDGKHEIPWSDTEEVKKILGNE